MIEPFVEPGWLEAHREQVTLVDVRWYLDGRSGRAAYEAGHLPGALYLELGEVLADPADPARGRHPLPSPQRFASGLGALGIGTEVTVVAYDDAGGVIASRLVWLLRVLGQPAALLDGGLRSWPGELETGPPPAARVVERAALPWPEHLLISIDEVADTDAVLIDARDGSRFAGGPDPVDPRSGHIPGARSLPAAGNLNSEDRMRTPDELRQRFERAEIDGSRPVVCYCGSGVSACHNLLALERAGLPPGRLYPGSWSQWSRDPQRPIETGAGGD